MSKKNKRKIGAFWKVLIIFAEVFLIATVIGLLFFWDFIEAYEASRPQNAIVAFMNELTPEKISGKDTKTLAAIDPHIRSEAQNRAVIEESLSGGITYAKNTKLSTEERMVYMVLSGGRTVGQVAMTVVRTDNYGFQYWDVTEQSYDFSHLIGETVSITVPEEYAVYADGALLDESYVTESGIIYDEVEEYYKEYDLPTMSTYTVGPALDEIVLTVKDTEGNPVEIGPDTDMNQFLKNCTQEELDKLNAFVQEYTKRYVDYTTVNSKAGTLSQTYGALVKLMVPDSLLASRMAEAQIGLVWVKGRSSELKNITVNRLLRLEEGRYLCDMSYTTHIKDGWNDEDISGSFKLIVVETETGLLTESMLAY